MAVALVVNVHAEIDVGTFGHLQGIGHLEAMTSSTAKGSHQQIGVGHTIRSTPFEGLLDGEILGEGLLAGIHLARHIHFGLPSEGNAHQCRTVAERPTE